MRAIDHFNGFTFAVTVFGIVLILVGMAARCAEAPDPAPSALISTHWTPCEPPRPGVECWSSASGYAVVCLPLTPEEKKP